MKLKSYCPVKTTKQCSDVSGIRSKAGQCWCEDGVGQLCWAGAGQLMMKWFLVSDTIIHHLTPSPGAVSAQHSAWIHTALTTIGVPPCD